MPADCFKFQETRYWPGSQPIVGFADKDSVLSVMTADEMATLYGGYLDYERIGDGHRFLGVWGVRKIARFFAALSKRGIALAPKIAGPDQFHMRHRASHPTPTAR